MVDLIGMFLEPIGGAKPKFSTIGTGIQLKYNSESAIALNCPAQGYPLPSFRLVTKQNLCRTNWRSKTKVFHLWYWYWMEIQIWICNCFKLSSTGLPTSLIQVSFSITLIIRTCGRYKTKVFWRCQFQRNLQGNCKICNSDLSSSELPNPSIQVSFRSQTEKSNFFRTYWRQQTSIFWRF